MIFFSPLIQRYTNLLKNTESPLEQARIRILACGLFMLLFLAALILGIRLFHPQTAIIVRLSIFLIILFYAGYLLVYKRRWEVSAHMLLSSLCLIVLTNLLLHQNGINLVTMQVSLIIISSSFYILGKNWGLIYSIANVVTITAHMLYTRLQDGEVYLNRSQLNSNTFMLAMIVNFILIIVIHHEFFRSFHLSHAKEKELNIQLQIALNEAHAATKMRTDFLSSMSHELRTPLHAVVSLTNILCVENPRKDQEENLAILRFSTENLLALIDDTLDFSKMNENKIVLNKTVFNLNMLLQNIYSTFYAKAGQKGLLLHMELELENEHICVSGDQTRLTQILNNLISNAIKFTDAGGKVNIIIKTLSRTEEHIQLSFCIVDTGIGIPKNKHDIVFEPFLQANNNITKRYGGTGLGLAIVKRLIALHGSELKLESEEHKGSSFSFELCYELAAEGSWNGDLLEKSDSVIDISNLHVLIAEDNLVNVMVLKKILDQWGCTYALANNGLEALEMAKTGEFNVILMDIHMPVMDGFEASKQIRALADIKISRIKIIALTASSDVDIQQSFSYAYLDDYLIKPFRPESLKTKLEALVPRIC